MRGCDVLNYYTVYKADSDEVVCSGTAEEICKYLNIGKDSLYCAISRQRSGYSKKTKYYYVVDDLNDEE